MDQGYVALAKSDRPRKQDAERVGGVDPTSQIEVTLTLRAPRLPELHTSKSTITRGDLESRYGASPDDIAKVKATLERYGLTVNEVSGVARSMRVNGTAAQMEEAFHPGMGMYRSEDQREFRGREGQLQIPVELNGLVTGVFGLDQRRVAHRAKGTPVTTRSETTTAAKPLTPTQLEQRYSFPAGQGETQKVGIIEFGGAYFPEMLSDFCQQQGLHAANVSILDVGLTPPTPTQVEELPEEQRAQVLGETTEVMMDIEIITGLCSASEIVVYFAGFDQKGWIDLLDKLIAGGDSTPPVLSISWGAPEDSEDWSEAALQEINQRLEAAAHLGITICVAAGDDGSGDQVEDGHAHVNFPASSPFVLSVGGTMLGEEREVVWWETPGRRTQQGGGSTGGGVSKVFPRPSWQNVKVESLNKGSIDGRVVPDVAALAGQPFYQLVIPGEEQFNGGTSAATPLWAALLTRIMASGKPTQRPAFIPLLLYENGPGGQPRGQVGCTDITEGNNASHPQPGVGYQADDGYDAVSGWGTPNGQQLLAALP